MRPFTFSKIFFSETAWPIKAKFYVEHPWVGGTKVCVFLLDRIRTLVAVATYASHRLIMEKSENCLFLLSCLRFLSPAFSKKSEGTWFLAFRPSVRPSFRPPIGVCTLCAQLLLQFYSDSFETLQMS